MPQTVAGAKITLETESAQAIRDLKRAADQVKRLRKTVDRSSNRITYAFNRLRRAAQVVASAFIFVAGIRQLTNLVSAMAKAEDQVLLMQARFQQFAREGDAFTKVYNQSLDLGISLKETADGMTRLLVATKGLGTAQPVLQDVLTNITLLGRAGGTSAEEMKGAMRQLSQGLASGRLQGEELRSVLENLPLVAMEIADQMGIGIGQIRQAAKEGKITGDVVIDALSNVDIKLEDLPKTWAMQTANLRTEWDLFLNDLSKSVDEAGLLSSLTDAVKWVRINALDSFVGISTGELEKQRTDIGAEISRLKALQQDAEDKPKLPTPRGAAAIEASAAFGGTGAEAYTRQLALQYDLLGDINKELGVRAEREELATKAAQARTALAEDKELTKRIKALQKQADSLRESIKTDQDKFFELVKAMDEMVELTDLTAAEATEIITQKYNEIMDAARDATDEEKKLLAELAESSEETFNEMARFADAAAKGIQDAFADFLFDPFDEGLKGMLSGFLDVIRRMLAEMTALHFINDTGIGGFLSAIGERAAGGPVTGGSPYLVGEAGPELFVPHNSGNIVPNHQLSGGGMSFNYSIDARGADEARIMRIMPAMMELTEQRTLATLVQMQNEGQV